MRQVQLPAGIAPSVATPCLEHKQMCHGRPTRWISLTLDEGKNRQVRRMTAAVGFPTLRLIRYRIGSVTLAGLTPGAARVLAQEEMEDMARGTRGAAAAAAAASGGPEEKGT